MSTETFEGRISFFDKVVDETFQHSNDLLAIANGPVRVRADAATDGPWKVFEEEVPPSALGRSALPNQRSVIRRTIGTANDHPQLKAPVPIVRELISPYYRDPVVVEIRPDDAAFMAEARVDVPMLLDVLKDTAARVCNLAVTLTAAGGSYRVTAYEQAAAARRLGLVPQDADRETALRAMAEWSIDGTGRLGRAECGHLLLEGELAPADGGDGTTGSDVWRCFTCEEIATAVAKATRPSSSWTDPSAP